MPLPLQRVAPGQKLDIPARDWNDMLEAARWVQAQKRALGGGPFGAPTPNPVIIRVKNTGTADVGAGGVLGIDEPIFPPPDANLSANTLLQIDLRCVKPTAEHRGSFVVTLQPLKKDAVGRAVIAGVCWAKVDAATEAAENYGCAYANESVSALKAGAAGAARILWRQDGTGEKWALVQIGRAVSPTLFHITGNRGGGGLYAMKAVNPSTTAIDSAANATAGSLGTDVEDEVTGLSLMELGASTHKLTHASNTSQLHCFGFPWGVDDAGRQLFIISHIWTKACS